MTNFALNQFKPEEIFANIPKEKYQILFVATIIIEVINESRLKHPTIKFQFDLNGINAFFCINAAYDDLKRALSNLINNAIDAIPKDNGEIRVNLKANDLYVHIYIIDNGAGIPADILAKINNNVAVTVNKNNGNGWGQVHDVINSHNAKFQIVSKLEGTARGTMVNLSLPRVEIPQWGINKIEFYAESTLVIFDSNNQGIWQQRFSAILAKLPHIKVLHFCDKEQLTTYLATPANASQQNSYLFCALNTTNQPFCLDLIKNNNFQHVVGITDYLIDHDLKKLALEYAFSLLPREFISVTPAKINQDEQIRKGNTANVHMVFVDDDKEHLELLVTTYFNHLVVDQYNNPHIFLEQVGKYPKDTKIILDNYYYYESGLPYNLDGIAIAAKLHQQGYTKLFLFSGEEFDVPDYLTLILKTDKDKLKQLEEL